MSTPGGARALGYRLLGPAFDYILHLRPAEWPIMAGHTLLGALLALGLPADGRDYQTAAAVLRALGLARIRLITNNPSKLLGLESHGIEIVERVALQPTLNPVNTSYLRTKVAKMGHLLSLASE